MTCEPSRAAPPYLPATMPAFENVWQLLHRLEGEVVSTFSSRKRHRYRIVKIMPDGIIRRTEQSGQSAQEFNAHDSNTREIKVDKRYFKITWERLFRVGVCGMEARHAAFVAACFNRLPELGVWYANTGRGWDYRTLLVLGHPASGNVSGSCDWDPSRIISDPKICGGTPTIKGTRVMVGNILGMFAGGYTAGRILESYPWLSMEDVEAAFEYSRVPSPSVSPHGDAVHWTRCQKESLKIPV